MEFTISQHAAKRMAQRSVTMEMVIDTFENPDEVYTDLSGTGVIYEKAFDHRGLFRLVMLAVDDDVYPNNIVAVMFDEL